MLMVLNKLEITFTLYWLVSTLYVKETSKDILSSEYRVLNLIPIYLIIIAIKYTREGFRPCNIITIFIPMLYLLIKKSLNFEHVFANIDDYLLIIFSIWAQFYFPVHNIPDPTGKYKVGFTEFQMDDKYQTEVSVFYPTKKDSIEDALWCDNNFYLKWAYMMVKKPNWASNFIFKTLLSFAVKYKMRVQKNAPILQDKLRVIIFSHGYSAHRNSYTCFTKELASQGYVVFCPEHYEKMKVSGYAIETDPEKKLELLKNQRNNDLEERHNVVCLNTSNIVLMGHSYGGATAFYTSLKFEELKLPKFAGVIAIDPWLFPLTERFLHHQTDIPILFLNTHYFNDNVPEYQLRQLNLQFFRKNQSDNKILGYLRFTDHTQPSDVPFLLPKELKLLKMITFDHLNVQCIEMNRKYIEIFLENIIFTDKTIDINDKENVVMEFDQFCEKKYGLPDFFVDEYAVFNDMY